jgi:hypothetical protein
VDATAAVAACYDDGMGRFVLLDAVHSPVGRAAFAWAAGVVAAAALVACPPAPPGSDGSARNDDDDDDVSTNDDGVCGVASAKPVAGPGAVVAGTRDPSHVQLDPAQIEAVVGVGVGNPPGASCSGTLIADDVVLTATHCTEGTPATAFFVTFGVDDYDPDLVVDVVDKSEHPSLDIAMLRLASAPPTQIDVRPIPAFGGTLTAADIGEVFEQAGFGATESGRTDGRYFVAEPLHSFEEGGYLVVDGEGRHGVCFGDSGGPSLRQTEDAGVRVVGVLSWGDPSCTGLDRFTRVDLVQDWLVDFAGPIPAALPQPCSDVDTAGRCSADARVATYCEGDTRRVDPCADDEVCLDDGTRARCVPAASAPCGTTTAFGACADGVLSWCDGDVVRTRDCGECGEQFCRLVDNAQGFACVDSACGDLDYRGECVGDTARWCDDGVIESLDCAAEGSRCAFIDDDTGFFCR